MKAAVLGSFLVLASLFALRAHAETVSVVEMPAKWRLENYMGDSVYVWYTASKSGSNCFEGHLKTPPTATAGDRNRLWATVATAKAHAKPMIMWYESTNCTLVGFSLAEE